MGLVLKIVGGLVALVLVAILAVVTVFWWFPVGLNNYANKVSIELVLNSPESITQLGLVDNSLLDFHSGKLDDYTEAQDSKILRISRSARAGLDKYGPKGLRGQETLTWAVLAHVLDDQIRAGESRIAVEPYRVNQISGVTIDMPSFLTDLHQVKNRQGAERYVARLVEFGRVLRETKARVEHDRRDGITPPDFIIDKTVAAMRSFISGGAEKNILVTSFRPKVEAFESMNYKTRDKLVADAQAAVEAQVIPGYEELIALFEEMRKTAPHDAGVWRLPGGAEYYAERLNSETTTNLTADQIHDIGLSEVTRIEAEMTFLLDALRVPAGPSVGVRVDNMMRDPAELYPNNDTGRGQMLDYLNSLKTSFDAKSKDWFRSLPAQPLEIVRVPEYAQDSSAGGYYNPPALDGSRPGRFYINLRNTADYPKWTLPTLFYHEAEPGHHFQLSAAQNVRGVPIIRQVVTPTAFAEGWGLYAEKLAKEMGLYDADPRGDVGRLQSEMFRAVRLVVDTGMHAKKWSREQAVDYMRAKTGMTEDEVTREIERYVAWPGQACSYKIGELTILRLRERAKTELGADFDIRGFHEQVLMNGGLPLGVLEQVINQWIGEEKARAAKAR